MISVEKIQSSTFSKLYEAFLIDDDPLSNEEDWRNVFDYAWDHGEGHCGYALLDNDQVVGFMGMIFSRRLIDGKIRKLCNLHTWWVREDYRGRSLALLRPILRLDGYTITHFTPCERIDAITKKLGFKRMSKCVKILLPTVLRRRAARGTASLIHKDQAIESELADHDRTILVDHRPYGCRNLMIRDGKNYCYILYTRVVRHWMPYCHIHYVSNKDIFAKHEMMVRSRLLKSDHARFVAMDSRLVSDLKFHSSFDSRLPANALYKSADLQPAQIDNLYSDVTFLKLTVFPDVTNELRRFASNFLPWK